MPNDRSLSRRTFLQLAGAAPLAAALPGVPVPSAPVDNMAELLATAAPLAWIDAILLKYSYRLEQDAALHLAIEACGQAGKGLTVMKVLADGPIRREHEEDMRLAGHFLARGSRPSRPWSRRCGRTAGSRAPACA